MLRLYYRQNHIQVNWEYLHGMKMEGNYWPVICSTFPLGIAGPVWWLNSKPHQGHWGLPSLAHWNSGNSPALGAIHVLSFSLFQRKYLWIFQTVYPPALQSSGIPSARTWSPHSGVKAWEGQWPRALNLGADPGDLAGIQPDWWFGSSARLPAWVDSGEWRRRHTGSPLHSCFSADSQALGACRKLKLKTGHSEKRR